MSRGWDASAYLEGLVGDGTEWTHERLAKATGIQQSTISGYVGGSKNLGIANATRIAAALGVTVADLGAPEVAVVTVATVDRRLQSLRAEVADLTALVSEALALLHESRGQADGGAQAHG